MAVCMFYHYVKLVVLPSSCHPVLFWSFRGLVTPVTGRYYAPPWISSSLEPVTDSLKKTTSLSKLWAEEPLVLSGKR